MNARNIVGTLIVLGPLGLAGTAAAQEAPVAIPLGVSVVVDPPLVVLTQVAAESATALAAHEAAAADGEVTEAERISLALDLPVAAELARIGGTTDDDVRVALTALSENHVEAHEAAAVLNTTAAAEVEHGEVESVGEFVRARVAEGLRGRELADAIRTEHREHGDGHRRAHREHGAPGAHAAAAEGADHEDGDDDGEVDEGEGEAGEHAEHGEAGNHGEAGGAGERGEGHAEGGEGREGGERGEGSERGEARGEGVREGGARDSTRGARPASEDGEHGRAGSGSHSGHGGH